MRRLIPFVVLIAVVAVLNGWLDQRFYVRVLTLSVVWALAGVAWNLMAKAGQISLGHSAFVGMGAYGFTILLRGGGTSPWVGMAIGMGVAAAVALAIGLPTFRLRGFYFTLATISFPLIMELLVSHYGDPELTVPFHPESEWKFMEFSNSHTYVWVGLGMLVIALAISELIDVTSFGFALRAIRDNEVLARAVGIRTVAWKSAAFMISAALSAAMAVLWVKAVLRVTVAEEVFGITVVIVMLSVAFVGGVGQTWGPVVGAAFLIPLAMFLDDSIGESVPGAQELVYAAALVLVALLIPRGILPAIEKGCRQLATRPRPSLEQAGPSLFGRLAAPPPRPSPLLRMPRRPVRARLPQPSDTPVLEVDGVAKSFGANRVLSDVAFSIDAGRRVGIIGPNGAGKTTLFNIMTAHLRADAGRILFKGNPDGPDARAAALRARHVTHVPGSPGFPSHVPARQCGRGCHRCLDAGSGGGIDGHARASRPRRQGARRVERPHHGRDQEPRTSPRHGEQAGSAAARRAPRGLERGRAGPLLRDRRRTGRAAHGDRGDRALGPVADPIRRIGSPRSTRAS